jgi:hypothetical protein
LFKEVKRKFASSMFTESLPHIEVTVREEVDLKKRGVIAFNVSYEETSML